MFYKGIPYENAFQGIDVLMCGVKMNFWGRNQAMPGDHELRGEPKRRYVSVLAQNIVEQVRSDWT